jgi:hypothetical protein
MVRSIFLGKRETHMCFNGAVLGKEQLKCDGRNMKQTSGRQ